VLTAPLAAALVACQPPRAAPPPPVPLVAEAGFIELADAAPATSHPRFFYSFHPADAQPETKPVALLFNGGPGFSTASKPRATS
jgi:hypothetical protein